MKINKNLQNIEKLYTDNLKEHGISSKSVGWPDDQAHMLRFEKLFGSIFLDSINSLNDLGSGYGAVLEYFRKREKDLKTYFAYDISKEMLDALEVKFYPKTLINKFVASYLKTKADFSIASGIFNVRFAETDDKWHGYILSVLHNLNEHSIKGFSFNLLSNYVDFKKDHLYYADPCAFFDYCKKNFSRKVNLYHDYPLWEWTIQVIK